MSFLDHIRACNAHDLGNYLPFGTHGQRVGWVRKDLVDALAGFAPTIRVEGGVVRLDDSLADFESRSRAVQAVLEKLVGMGRIVRLQGELYAVSTEFGASPLFAIDRAAVAHFGIASYGLHVNGIVETDRGTHLWIGRRAKDKSVAPGKLDNIVAGGQPYGLTLADNLVKECAEEADIPEALARKAVPVGAVTYLMENRDGLKPDTLFIYDLKLSENFVPRNTDGEIEEFRLWPVEEVMERVRTTDDFKFNVNLVLIDFFVRHGFLRPEDPDYLEIVKGLRR